MTLKELLDSENHGSDVRTDDFSEAQSSEKSKEVDD